MFTDINQNILATMPGAILSSLRRTVKRYHFCSPPCIVYAYSVVDRSTQTHHTPTLQSGRSHICNEIEHNKLKLRGSYLFCCIAVYANACDGIQVLCKFVLMCNKTTIGENRLKQQEAAVKEKRKVKGLVYLLQRFLHEWDS